ncbi:hypothetical protein HDU76_002464 [Blyttiomyces sp. JEL0837]|nr:hypothetical protein HDU76_002464 [Blyttiomyces sp. JEL0837]
MNGIIAENLQRYKIFTETHSFLNIGLISPTYIQNLTAQILSDPTISPKPEDFASPEGHANWQGTSLQQILATFLNLTFRGTFPQDTFGNATSVDSNMDLSITSSSVPSMTAMVTQSSDEQSANVVDSIGHGQQPLLPLSVHSIEQQLQTSAIARRSCYNVLSSAGADWILDDEKTRITKLLATIYSEVVEKITLCKTAFRGKDYAKRLKTILEIAALLHQNQLVREKNPVLSLLRFERAIIPSMSKACRDRFLAIQKLVWPMDAEVNAKTFITKAAKMISAFIKELNEDIKNYSRCFHRTVAVIQMTGTIFWLMIVKRLRKVENVIDNSCAGVDGLSIQDFVRLSHRLKDMAVAIPRHVPQ